MVKTPDYMISFFFKKIRERKLKNSELEIILIYDYNIFEIKDIYEYKKDLDKLFSDFNLISVVEDNLIKGNFKRRKYSIYSKFRMPSDMENNLHYTQTVTVDYVDFKDCLSTLFDNIRLINNLNYVSDDLKEFNIRIGTDFFNDNKLIKLMGSSITGDFTIKKEEKETILIYNGGLIQESIHHLNKIIIALADF